MGNKVWYRAKLNGMNLTSVLAESEEDARERVRYELKKNPSRRQVLQPWEDAGAVIEPDES